MVVEFIKKNLKGDKGIWLAVALLGLLGLPVVYSATGLLAIKGNKTGEHFLISHFVTIITGVLLIFVFHRVNYIIFKKIAKWLFILCVPLLLYTLFFGTELNQGSRWITIPVINKTFQTSDLARLSIFMFLADLLSKFQDRIEDFKKGFVPILIPVLVICGLIAPANMSTALLLGVTCCMLFFMGRVKLSHIAILVGAGLVILVSVYGISKLTGWGRAETWENRITNFMGGGDEDDNFQAEQAQIAIANGGFFGTGPGNSVSRNYLPHPYSDFIFAIFIEEYGVMGGLFLMSIYIFFLWRSIQIFRKCPYAFGAFLSIGLSFTLVFQAMINMAVNVQLLPVTGLTLPLVSMGGSSVWFNCTAIGIILSVSNYVESNEPKFRAELENSK